MKRFIGFTIMIFFLFNSCIYMHTDDSIDLGDNYRFIQDYPKTIIYHRTPKYNGTGLQIIPPNVEEYNFDKSYIIARTKDENEVIKYWILDKSSYKIDIPLQPMDSVEFYKSLSAKNINLSFEN